MVGDTQRHDDARVLDRIEASLASLVDGGELAHLTGAEQSHVTVLVELLSDTRELLSTLDDLPVAGEVVLPELLHEPHTSLVLAELVHHLVEVRERGVLLRRQLRILYHLVTQLVRIERWDSINLDRTSVGVREGVGSLSGSLLRFLPELCCLVVDRAHDPTDFLS